MPLRCWHQLVCDGLWSGVVECPDGRALPLSPLLSVKVMERLDLSFIRLQEEPSVLDKTKAAASDAADVAAAK